MKARVFICVVSDKKVAIQQFTYAHKPSLNLFPTRFKQEQKLTAANKTVRRSTLPRADLTTD
jgi:hypothetical protein